MINVPCDLCSNQITNKAGLLFSPPHGKNVEKWHVCSGCYESIIEDAIENADSENTMPTPADPMKYDNSESEDYDEPRPEDEEWRDKYRNFLNRDYDGPLEKESARLGFDGEAYRGTNQHIFDLLDALDDFEQPL